MIRRLTIIAVALALAAVGRVLCADEYLDHWRALDLLTETTPPGSSPAPPAPETSESEAEAQAPASSPPATGVAWVTPQQAYDSPLPELYFIAGQACPPCEVLKRLFSDPKVVAWSRHFDCVMTGRLDELNNPPGSLPPAYPVVAIYRDKQQWQDGGLLRGWHGCPWYRLGREKSDANDLAWELARAYREAKRDRFGAEKLPADSQPTPLPGVDAVLEALHPRPDEVLVDFGCGFDARMLTRACERYGVKRAIGLEIVEGLAESAERHVFEAGLSDNIVIYHADATTADVPATVGVAYLWPTTLAAMRPKLQRLQRFASYQHQVPGGVPGMTERLVRTRAGDVWLYERAKVQPAAIYRQRNVAVWNGRTYTQPVCSRPGCTMCASIRRQLAR